MRIIDLPALERGQVDAFGSSGFAISRLLGPTPAVIHTAQLEPGGVIGSHETRGEQLLVVLSGTVDVSGADDAPETITAGQAARWTTGERHETRTAVGALLLIVEFARE
jgi:uncharacterized cupin superfamily protein